MREETLVKNLLAHKRVIEGMIAAMTGDPVAAEDLFQEVAIIMTRKREETPEDCRFAAWAKTIAWNVVRDWRKKKARAKVRFLADDALEGVAQVFVDTDEEAWEQRRDALKRCSEKLPEREREVVRRRYEQAEPVESIASWLRTSRGAVDTLLFRIRKALHACVQGKLHS